MRKLILTVALALLVVPVSARAQLGFGPQVSYGTDSDLGIGARAVLSLPILTGFQAIGSADYFFIDCAEGVDCSWMEFNANGTVPLPIVPLLTTYIGGGLNLTRVKVDTNAGDDTESRSGFNILAGIKLPGIIIKPFAEARFIINGGEQFVLTAGFLLGG